MLKKNLPGPQGMRFLPIQSITPRTLKNDAGEDVKTFDVAVSSEYVVERDFYGMKWREVLDHSPTSIALDRFKTGRAAVLEEHRGVPVGVINETYPVGADRVLRTNIRFSRSVRGQEAEMDMEDGIRPNISVGYIPKRAVLMEEDAERGDLWRFMEWEPVELSLVGIPADPTVGAGRNADGAAYPPVIIEDGRAVKEERSMNINGLKLNDGAAGGTGPSAPPVTPQAAAPARPEERATASTPAALAEVAAMAEANGCSHLLSDWFARGITNPADIAVAILRERKTSGTSIKPSEAPGLPAKDMRNYRYQRAILGAALVAEGKPWTGLEAEVHQEMERNAPPSIERRGGVLVPLRTMEDTNIQTRILASNAGTKGAETVFEQSGELIELLRNRTTIIKRGARLLSGLTSPIAFPKQTGAMTASWVGENPGADIADSDIALGLALLAPKTLQASAQYSRQLLMQSSIDVEGMVRDEMSIVHAIAIDRAGLHGLGAAGEPAGVYKAIGVQKSAFGGAATYAKLLAMQGLVAIANADLGALGWVMHPTMITNLRGVLDFPAVAAGRPIWTGTYVDGEAAAYPGSGTNQMSNLMTGSERTGGAEIGCIFGNWADMIIGSFGALELIVDPYRLKKQGIIEVTSFQMCDILIRHGESFVASTGATG